MEGCSEISQESDRIVILIVKINPGGGKLELSLPGAEEGGFAIACRGGDQNKATFQPLVQFLEQARTRDRPGTNGRS